MWDVQNIASIDLSRLFGTMSVVLLFVIFLSLFLARYGQSLLIGYFACGVVVSNSGLLPSGSQEAHHLVANFAEIGIILLMFSIGVEFSLREFRSLRRTVLLGGSVQVLATMLLFALVAWGLKFSLSQSLLLGFMTALSSTAVAMKSFQDLGKANTAGAKTTFGIALFQDLVVIALLLLLPAVQNGNDVMAAIRVSLIKGVIFLLGSALLGRYGIRPLIHSVAQTRSHELFTLVIICLCSSVTFAGGALGLGFALGAFAAGMMVSESIYSHRILSEVLPFKNLFLTVFFISVGMMVDLRAASQNWLFILCLTAIVFVVKSGIAFLVARMLKLPLRAALLSAASLACLGEFSIVLMQKSSGLLQLSEQYTQAILLSSALSMAMVPASMRASGKIATFLQNRGFFQTHRIADAELTSSKKIALLKNHAIICGYGPVGQRLHEELMNQDVTCLIMDLNADTVRALKQQSHPVLFADASHHEALSLAKIETARLIAFTFPSTETIVEAIRLIREKGSSVCILARAKFSSDAEKLNALGAVVIHDEEESAHAMCLAAVQAMDEHNV